MTSSPIKGSKTRYLNSGPFTFEFLTVTDMHCILPRMTGTSSTCDCSNSLMNYIAYMWVELDFCPVSGCYSSSIFNASSSSSKRVRSDFVDDGLSSVDCPRWSKYCIRWLFVNSCGVLPFGFKAFTSAPLSKSYWTILTELVRHATCKGVPCSGDLTSMSVLLHKSKSSIMVGYIRLTAM